MEGNAMRGINKVILVGHVGKAPELRHTQDGRPFTSFSLATGRMYTSRTGEKREETEWHKLVAFGKLAEIASAYVGKGRPLYIEGRLHSRSYQDSNGTAKTATEVHVDTLQLLGKTEDRSSKPALPILGLHGHDEKGLNLAFAPQSLDEHADIPF